MTDTSIEWADKSWNPIAAYDKETGKRGWFCTKVSPGCTNCYAEKFNQFRGNGHLYRVGNLDKVRFELAPTLTDPLHWRKPRQVFVNSMTDLFLEAHTDEMINAVFAVMAQAQRHQFLVLTKRPERMLAYTLARLAGLPLPNVWLGVSVENQAAADERIPLLVQTPAAIRFLSCEPLLSPIDFYGAGSYGPEQGDPEAFSALKGYDGTDPKIPGIDWVIVGGESGPRARACNLEWIRLVVEDCAAAGVPTFVKQVGSQPFDWEEDGVVGVDVRDQKGGDPAEWPTELRIREFPKEAATV